MTSFVVAATPAPQGSKNAYLRGARVVLVESSTSLPAWRRAVAEAARAACDDYPLDGALDVDVTFYVPRPKSVARRARAMPTVKPDVDKLVRSLFDGITDGALWVDDARVTDLAARKRYADDHPVGAVVTVTPHPPETNHA